MLRDLGYEVQNWAFVIQAYDYLGRILQADKDYEFALIAYKKLLQLSWVNNSYEYEIRAYSNLAKQYYYLQNPQKCSGYAQRALTGFAEPKTSHQRSHMVEMFKK